LLVLFAVLVDLIWRHMGVSSYPGSGIYLVAGFVSLLLLIESALVIPMRKRRVILVKTPLASVSGQAHTVLAVATLVTGLLHSGGNLDPSKSGTYLLASICVTTALGAAGRLFEQVPALRERFSDSVFSKLWRQAHRLSTWIVLGCLLWHLIAVVPLLFNR
jgi:hypothetical protein